MAKTELNYKCPKCKVIYFEEQECDWCPVKTVLELGQIGTTGTGKFLDGSPCTGCYGTGQIAVDDGHHGLYGHMAECPRCAITRTNGAGDMYDGR